MPPISYNGRRALAHLKKLRPSAGWAIDMNKDSNEYRLMRRGIVPLTKGYFRDIHHDAVTGNVVGIIAPSSERSRVRGQVLVDDQGKTVRSSQPAIITITTWSDTAKTRSKTRGPSSSSSVSSSSSKSRRTTTTASTTTVRQQSHQPQQKQKQRQKKSKSEYSLSPAHDRRLMKGALYIVGVAIAIKALMNIFEALRYFIIPIIYVLALLMVPSEKQFTVAEKVKQALLRSHQLYDQPSNKSDEDWINEKMKKLRVEGEDYDRKVINLGGAVLLMVVRIPSMKRKFFWLGVFRRWRHLFSFELDAMMTKEEEEEQQVLSQPGE